MAIYHLHAKIIQRSKGKNVVAAAAYRHAARMVSESEGMAFDYTDKPHVIHSEIVIPNNAPEWLTALMAKTDDNVNQSSQELWNLVESVEKRKDAQLAREFEFSLPIELTQDQNIQLAREFIHDQFVLRGMVADFSIHWDPGNPHAHVLLSTREITEEGFGKKVTAWNSKILLQEWREKWAEYANFHLRLHAHTVRIDHRSYEEQGIDLIPGIHEGKAVTDMERRGLSTDIMQEANNIRRENLTRICADPNILLDKLASQQESFTASLIAQELGRYINDQGKFSIVEQGVLSEITLTALDDELQSKGLLTPDIIAKILSAIEVHESVFTDRDLAKAIAPYTQNADLFAQAVLQVKASKDLIPLGPGDDGRDRFTTRRLFDVENELQKKAELLRKSIHVKISDTRVTQVLNQYEQRSGKHLTEEQLTAVKHMLKKSSISCVVGRAGTGKSFSLAAAKAVWESQGLKVYGVALSGIAADGLAKDAQIDSRTIESFRYAVKTGHIVLSHHTVVIMDEAGMSDSHSMLSVLNVAQKARAKLVLVGDHAQIQPVGPGASFRALVERLGFAELQMVYRQKEQWQRDATVALSAGKVSEALSFYDEQGCVHWNSHTEDAMNALVHDWSCKRESHAQDLSQYLVVAHRNADVHLLNQRLRQERVEQGEIAEGYLVQAKSGLLNIAEGDRLLFLKNDRLLGVSNGRFATIKTVTFSESGRVIGFNVILDGSKKEVHVNPNEYTDFALGYAATVHKVQGMTVDHTFVYAGGRGWNRHLSYVAMSRHRESCDLYADQETYKDEKSLINSLGRLGIKDSLLDYPLAFAERRGIDTSILLKFLPKKLAECLTAFKDHLVDRSLERLAPGSYQQQQAEHKSRVREDARRVADYVDLNRAVGIAWKLSQDKWHQGDFDQKQLQEAIHKRNAVAAELMQEPKRYQKAMEMHHLNGHQLKKQANHHAYRSLDTFKNTLKNYVAMELKQTRLVNHRHSVMMSDPKASQVTLTELVKNSKNMLDLVTSAIKDPNIAGEMELLKNMKPESLAQRGGYVAIYERFSKDEFLKEDIQTILMQMRTKSLEHMRTQERDRGGRSR